MGLDIDAYEKVTFLQADVEDGQDPSDIYEKHEHVFHLCAPSPSFVNRAFPLQPGYYAASGRVFGFRAGSYSGYNQWRRDLARFAHEKTDREVWEEADHLDQSQPGQSMPAFYELIAFSDCEGILGAAVSEKLYLDFIGHRKAIEEVARIFYARQGVTDEWHYFRQRYEDWAMAFDLARGEGVVLFG